MNTTINADVTTASVDTKVQEENIMRQSIMRDFFHTARNGQGSERLEDEDLFSYKDLRFFRGLYGGYTKRDGTEVPGFLTKISKFFPIGVKGEFEKLQRDRLVLKVRGEDFDEYDLRRYLYILNHMQKLQAVISYLDKAILKRRIAYAESKESRISERDDRVYITQGIKQGAQWIKDRDVTKAEALQLASLTEDKLSAMLRDSKLHSTTVLCIYNDRERLSYEKSGAAIRYVIEKRA